MYEDLQNVYSFENCFRVFEDKEAWNSLEHLVMIIILWCETYAVLSRKLQSMSVFIYRWAEFSFESIVHFLEEVLSRYDDEWPAVSDEFSDDS